jgi:diguanylate cyclase (GGDEF)-like protein
MEGFSVRDIQVNKPSQAKLGHNNVALRWLLQPRGDVNDVGRAFLLGQLLGSPAAVIMGSCCALMVVIVAILRSDEAIYGFIATLELVVMTWRIAEWRRRTSKMRQHPDHIPSVDTSVLLSILWCTLQGVTAFTIMSSRDLVLCILSATLVMALVGPICARNYAAPRSAFLLVLLCDLPFVAGALASGEPWLLVIVAMTPPFLLGAMQIIMTFHRTMLLTLAMEAKALHLAQHDSLTGILSRQGMDHALSQFAPHPDRQMALISIDLDGFKQVNDTHGHGAGDILLVKVAQRIKSQLRSEDLLARMGGDEFVVVVRDMMPDQVGPLADRLISAISRYSYDLQGGSQVRVGASIGFACMPEDAASTVELRSRADQALYTAKDAGKGVGRRFGTLAAAAPARVGSGGFN